MFQHSTAISSALAKYAIPPPSLIAIRLKTTAAAAMPVAEQTLSESVSEQTPSDVAKQTPSESVSEQTPSDIAKQTPYESVSEQTPSESVSEQTPFESVSEESSESASERQQKQLKQMMEKFAQEQYEMGMKNEAGMQDQLSQEQQQQQSRGSSVRDRIGRALGVLGNVAFYGTIIAGVYFGYYTYKYNIKEVKTIITESESIEEPNPLQIGWSKVMTWYVEQREAAELQMKQYMEPTVDVLLPPIPEQYRRYVNTLVLDLDGVLVYSEWTRARGWKHFKRQGAHEFLEALYKSGYEIVVYTDQLNTYADPLLNKLDKEQIHQDRFIGHRLYQSSTVLKGGKRYRDLNRLGRDMTRVLYVTADPETTEQHENTILIKPWKMENDDTVLLDLIPFFEMVAQTSVPDLRDIVKSYQGQDIPTAYKERLKSVQQQPQQRQRFFGVR